MQKVILKTGSGIVGGPSGTLSQDPSDPATKSGGTGSGNPRPSSHKLSPFDINRIKEGESYELSINGGEPQPYKIELIEKRRDGNYDITLSRANSSHAIITSSDKIQFAKKLTPEEQKAIEDKQKAEAEEKARKKLQRDLEAERETLKRAAKEKLAEEQKSIRERLEKRRQELLAQKKQKELTPEEKENLKQLVAKNKEIDEAFLSGELDETESIMMQMINGGIKNIWLVGPAGSGKSTISRNVAQMLERECHVLSCGIGTSSTEFIGFKYPEREATPFSEFYTKPSIIVLDEFTALDPAVAQIANAALANDELYTTTGLIKRHPECIIVATSNTFGTGGDLSYVANNQLDASTIDRFIGGIIEVNYSEKYESQFDPEVVAYVYNLRNIIARNGIQKIASTRSIIEGEKLKKAGLHWRSILVANWPPVEKELLYVQ